MHSIEKRIVTRIQRKGRGWCFTPKVFLDLGSPESVRISLYRLQKRGTVRRLARGLYDFPRQHTTIGLLSPSPDEVAKAMSERYAARIQPSGAYAANLLGLSDQVPARIVFLTDGPSRHVRIGRQEVVLRNTTTRNMAAAGRISSTVVQAFRHLGVKQIDGAKIAHLRKTLRACDKNYLKQDKIYAPDWMHRLIDAIVKDSHA
jgi:predicted transcriptional regulator of viral defense system